jgi:hypothetical protein
MAHDRLGTYLADHLAGSVSAAELVERLMRTDIDPTLATALRQVGESITRHQQVLRGLLERRGRADDNPKNFSAWLAEKMVRPAMPVDRGDEFGLLRAIEALLLGMQGRVALWQSMEAILPSHPELSGLDATGLRQEAEQQVRMMDGRRLEVARLALRGWTGTDDQDDPGALRT